MSETGNSGRRTSLSTDTALGRVGTQHLAWKLRQAQRREGTPSLCLYLFFDEATKPLGLLRSRGICYPPVPCSVPSAPLTPTGTRLVPPSAVLLTYHRVLIAVAASANKDSEWAGETLGSVGPNALCPHTAL